MDGTPVRPQTGAGVEAQLSEQITTVAPLPRRLLAYALDTAPFAVLWSVIVAATGSGASLGRSVGIALWLALFLAYFTVAVARYGRTLGMATLRLRVVADAGPRGPSWWRSFARALVQCAARPTSPLVVSLPVGLAVYGPVLFVRNRRGLHDFAGGTVVVIARRA